ncbi:MAG: dCTP deaminase [Candidatus Micrarchaeota archaeon]|nr:dCTP deaminase [Candidatus Micrarchaeota archaeon]
MILSDRSIRQELARGRIVVKPFYPNCVQPSSIDLHLSNEFRVFKHSTHPVIDVRKKFGEYTELIKVKDDTPFIIHPNEFVLGSTVENVEIPGDIVGRLEGKSSLGRLGIIIHATAGYVDPGWKGRLTLEISNVGKIPVTLYPDMKIAQLSFLMMTTPADNLYGSKKTNNRYQYQRGPTESKIFKG